MNEITILLPAFNEEKNINEMIESWQGLRETIKLNFKLYLKIVLINDGSSDSTKEICSKLIDKYDNFNIINHEKNMGLGAAVKTGIKYIIESGTDTVFFCIMDCDNTQDPKYIIDMLKKQKDTNADVVIASRYQKGSNVLGVPKIRLFTSICAKWVFSFFLRVKNVRDYTCGYRLYKKSIIEKLHIKYGDNIIEENGFTCMAELLYKLYKADAVYSEVPFVLKYNNKRGISKMKVIKTAVGSFKLIKKLRK